MNTVLKPQVWELEDALIILGSAGLITGIGGKYFFVIPVAKWTNPSFGPSWGGGGTSAWGLFVPTSFKESVEASLSFMFNLDMKVFGLDQQTTWSGNTYTPGMTPWTYEGANITPGPLGKSSGYIFLLAIIAGLGMKFY